MYFLLDCGLDDRFDAGYMEALRLRAPQINAVLLTYPDIAHIGALPFLVGKCGLNCPVYATVSFLFARAYEKPLCGLQVPVYKMGQLFLYDWLSGHNNVEDFSLFNFDDVDAAFEKVQQVKYSQTVRRKIFVIELRILIEDPAERRQRSANNTLSRRAHNRRSHLADNEDGRRGNRLCCRLQPQEGTPSERMHIRWQVSAANARWSV